jgi:hypothetical protein
MSSRFLQEFFAVAVIPPEVIPEIVFTYHAIYAEQLDFNASVLKAKGSALSRSTGLEDTEKEYDLDSDRTSELLNLTLSEILRRAMVRMRMHDMSRALPQCLGNGSTALSVRTWMIFLGLAENGSDVPVKTVAATANRLALAEQ